MKIHMLRLLCLLFAVSCSDSKQTIETTDAPMAADREIGDGLPQDDPTLITGHLFGPAYPWHELPQVCDERRNPTRASSRRLWRHARHGRRHLPHQSEARCARDARQSRPSHLGGGIHLGGD